MYTFEQLYLEISKLIKNNIDIKKNKILVNLETEVKTQELYYTNIPDAIKTESTLQYIILKLVFKLNQFIFQSQNKIKFNTNFEMDSICSTENEISSSHNNLINSLIKENKELKKELVDIKQRYNNLVQNLAELNL